MYREDFERKAKEILQKALDESYFEREDLENAEDFENAIWNDKDILRNIGEQFFDALINWNGDDTFEEIRKELLEEKGEEEEEEEEDLEE